MPNDPESERIHIQPEAIGHLIADTKLVVPINQRSYAWKDEQVLELFTDISGAIRNEPEYFLGSIVVAQGAKPGEFEVADGQQRLATVTILLGAIRDYFHSKNDHRRSIDIERTYLQAPDLRSLDDIFPKLTLNVEDNEFFRERILLSPADPARILAVPKNAIDSHKRLDAAARQAVERVEAIIADADTDEDRASKLLDWVEYLKHKVRVILVRVEDQGIAWVIFETLNDRGLDLTKADLVKNYLFGKAKEHFSSVQQRWQSMVGVIESVSSESIIPTYIRHVWISQYGPTRDRDLYKSVKTHIRSKSDIMKFSTVLAENAKLYAAILNPDHELWNSHDDMARFALQTLIHLRMEQVRPLVLMILKHFNRAETRKSLESLVAWSVRFMVSGGHGGGVLEKHYGDRALEVSSGKIKTALQLAKAMVAVVPTDSAFETAFAAATVSQNHLARYYLHAIQSYADDSFEYRTKADKERIDLEHILPENPEPSSNWLKCFTKDEAKAYWRRIGNMALLRKKDNSVSGREIFDVKKAVYANSAYSFTRMLANVSVWTPAEIENRQKTLAEAAVKTWPIFVKA